MEKRFAGPAGVSVSELSCTRGLRAAEQAVLDGLAEAVEGSMQGGAG